MGDDAEDSLTSTNIFNGDQKYRAVIKQYEFFQVQKNVIYEWARFNRRCQTVSESVEQFITILYTFVENCDYGDLKDQMIDDCIVIGIHYQAQSEWFMQTDAGLTLEKAKMCVWQCDAVQEQEVLVKHSQNEEKSIDFQQQNLPSKAK